MDSEQVLDRVLEEARTITGARYAALGVLDEQRIRLERFVTAGVDPATHSAIGELPRGRGVLGVLIADPHPQRLADVGRHPRSYGLPGGHPPMHSFLGVPIIVGGQAWGNLYLAEKEEGAEFTDEDEEAVTVLAQWTATAIENARLYGTSERRREQLEQAVQGLEAARDIADATGRADDPKRVLELIVKRGRALIDSRTLLIMLCDGDDLVVAAGAGHKADALGRRLSLAGSALGHVLERARPERITDLSADLRIARDQLGVEDARTALLVPMCHAGNGLGILAAFDRGDDRGVFTETDEQLLRTFAASATQAIALRRSAETDRVWGAIVAADAERRRWARELHDETLQTLGSLRLLLASALRRGDAVAGERAIHEAVAAVDQEIASLRARIENLRPVMLDELGLPWAQDAARDRPPADGLDVTGGEPESAADQVAS